MSDQIGNAGGTMAVPAFSCIPSQDDPTAFAQQFNALAERWKRETGHLSNVTRKCTHPAYQRIIGLGLAVVPLILADLKSSHADWFWALSAITGESPIPEHDAGDVALMTEAWLRWGKAAFYEEKATVTLGALHRQRDPESEVKSLPGNR